MKSYLSLHPGILVAALACALPASAPASQKAVEPPSPTDAVYAALRSARLGGEVATVNNLALRRDAGVFTLKSGELYFLEAVEGRVTGAVFVGEGEFALTPPLEHEKQALAIYAKAPTMAEQFTELVLRFSDATYDEVKAKAPVGTGGAQASRAADIYEDHVRLVSKRLRENIPLRTLVDVYDADEDGFFAAFIKGKRWSKLIYLVDPAGIPDVAPEQVMLASYGEADAGVWAAFPLAGAAGTVDARTFDIKQHEISVTIEGTKVIASDRVDSSIHSGRRGARRF